jgi:hypothetical protein
MVLDDSSRVILLSDLTVLQVDSGAQVDLFAFRDLVYQRRLPMLTKSILLEVDGRTMEVPVVQLSCVEVLDKGGKAAKWIGLAVGAALDVAAINELNRVGCGDPFSCNTKGCDKNSNSCN